MKHGQPAPSGHVQATATTTATAAPQPIANPDEIAIDSDDEDEHPIHVTNADEIAVDDEDDEMGGGDDAAITQDQEESVDVVEAERASEDPIAGHEVIGGDVIETMEVEKMVESEIVPKGSDDTRFLALDKCGPGKDFIQVGGDGSMINQNISPCVLHVC